MIGAVSGVPRLHGIFAGKHFSFSGVILFPSFMLLLCSVADYLVKKRKPSFLCLPTLHTSLKRIQWVQFLVTWNTDWEREKKNKQTNKVRAFSLTRIGVPFSYIKISVGLSEVAVYFPWQGYILVAASSTQNIKGHVTGGGRRLEFMFHRVVRGTCCSYFFAYLLKD